MHGFYASCVVVGLVTQNPKPKSEPGSSTITNGSVGSAVIRMEGAMATMSHSDFKCPIGKGSLETMSHYFLEP